ncbi:hypothetical protein [Kitasatospora sp. NPDC004531]
MPALPEQDFEDRLGRVFRETGESFVADAPLLVLGGADRGRRRQRRRLTLVASVAVVAACGVTAGVLPTVLSTDGIGPAAPAVAPPSASATPAGALIPQEAHMVSAVAERLPPGVRIVRSDGSTAGSAAIPSTRAWAEMTLDDGGGESLLAVTVSQVDEGWPQPCTAPEIVPDAECRGEVRPDGSAVSIVEYSSGGKDPNRHNGITWVTPDGMKVIAISYNFGRKTGEWTRPAPLLDIAQLRALVTDPGWRTFEASVRRTLPKYSADTPVQRPDLLPPDLKVVAVTTGPEQTVTLADGNRTVVLRYQEEQAEESAQAWFADAPELPDGSRVRSVADRPVPGSQGSTESVVDLLRPDGRRIRVTAVNPAGTGHPDAGREPLLTLDRLTAIASCPGWTVPRR